MLVDDQLAGSGMSQNLLPDSLLPGTGDQNHSRAQFRSDAPADLAKSLRRPKAAGAP